MKIVIPMAGHSRRFQEAGYTVPKAFIPIDGRPMIEHVCRMFDPTDEFLFVCNENHLKVPEFKTILERATPRSRIIPIAPHEKGPLFSTLAADPFMKADEPIIISYCDFTVRWDYRQFLLKSAMGDGSMAVFRGFHPASFGTTLYAYVRTNENQEMLELREKQCFTDNRSDEYASTGIYYVDRWDTCRQYAKEVLKIPINTEYYASLIYNPMVRDGKTIMTFEVEKFICWGTPHDLEQYFFWSSYFHKDALLSERAPA